VADGTPTTRNRVANRIIQRFETVPQRREGATLGGEWRAVLLQRWHGHADHVSMSASGVLVPGGVITIDLSRDRNPLWTWLRVIGRFLLVGGDELRLKRDIVIQDVSRGRELYREGPYNGITVVPALKRIESEIKSEGMNQFLFKRQAEDSRIGPISRPSGQVGFWSTTAGSIRYYRQRLFRSRPRRTSPPYG